MATSKDFNAKNAIAELKKLGKASEIAAFVEGEDRTSVLNAAKKLADDLAAPAPEPVGKKPAPMQVNEKLADPTKVMAAYDQLINELAKTEAAQRQKKKPYRVYFVHRKRAEVMRLNFKKSMR
jgi:uncharacterized membrane protein YccC